MPASEARNASLSLKTVPKEVHERLAELSPIPGGRRSAVAPSKGTGRRGTCPMADSDEDRTRTRSEGADRAFDAVTASPGATHR